MVHGLASKRPEKDVHELWSLCIRESLVDYTIITGHMGKEEQNETHRTGKSQLKCSKIASYIIGIARMQGVPL